MYKGHLEFLVCPKCKGQLDVENAKDNEEFIYEGKLLCRKCGGV